MSDLHRFRSPLSGARLLGSAHGGSRHWLAQRLTALGLIPLGLATIILAYWLMQASYMTIVGWFHQPWALLLAVLLVGTVFYHGYLGLKVVIEDYVHHKGALFVSLAMLRFVSIVLALLGIIAAAEVAFRG